MTPYDNDLDFDQFKAGLDETIKRHAPIQKRYVRANEVPFINKKINKEIMKRCRLRNKFLNAKSDIDKKAYNKQRHLCVSLIRSEKKNFFSNINTGDITDSKTFWKTVKSFFIDKIKTKSKITLRKKKPLKVKNAVSKFRNHSSIIMIKNKKKKYQSFSFDIVIYDDVLKN